MAKNISYSDISESIPGEVISDDFDFSSFYEDEEETEDDVTDEECEYVRYDQEEEDRLVSLNNNERDIAVEAEYPYVKISGFIIKDEIVFMRDTLKTYQENLTKKYSSDELMNVVMEINGNRYNVARLPLNLDTFLTIFKAHRYNVFLVRGAGIENEVTSELMKAFLMT